MTGYILYSCCVAHQSNCIHSFLVVEFDNFGTPPFVLVDECGRSTVSFKTGNLSRPYWRSRSLSSSGIEWCIVRCVMGGCGCIYGYRGLFNPKWFGWVERGGNGGRGFACWLRGSKSSSSKFGWVSSFIKSMLSLGVWNEFMKTY